MVYFGPFHTVVLLRIFYTYPPNYHNPHKKVPSDKTFNLWVWLTFAVRLFHSADNLSCGFARDLPFFSAAYALDFPLAVRWKEYLGLQGGGGRWGEGHVSTLLSSTWPLVSSPLWARKANEAASSCCCCCSGTPSFHHSLLLLWHFPLAFRRKMRGVSEAVCRIAKQTQNTRKVEGTFSAGSTSLDKVIFFFSLSLSLSLPPLLPANSPVSSWPAPLAPLTVC